MERAYLATEDNYRSVRALQQKNLIVPMVGNFAGPKTLRAIGGWVARSMAARVTTFYSSNVEQYLFQDGIWGDFAGNLATLPTDRDQLVHPVVLHAVRERRTARAR